MLAARLESGEVGTLMISLMGHDLLSWLACCHCIQNQGAASMEEGVKGCWVDS